VSEIKPGAPVKEGYLEFKFQPSWRVWKWDGHPSYRNGIQKLQTSEAVDFVGLRGSDLVCFIEVKDYRGHSRKKNDDLVTWVARKVRDTVAGIVGAHYMRSDGSDWKLHLDAWSENRRLQVLLWLEGDHLTKAELAVLTDGLKRRLRWLTSHVLVANLADPPGLGFSVRNLPGAGQGRH